MALEPEQLLVALDLPELVPADREPQGLGQPVAVVDSQLVAIGFLRS